MTSWPAVLAVARSEARRRWASLLVLGVLAGLVGAVVAGSTAVARRTATAYDRLAAASHIDDARVLVFSDSVDVAEIARFPGVTEAWPSRQVIGAVVGAPVIYLSVSSGPPRRDDLFTPVVVEGREPRDDAVGEVLVPAQFADEVGISVGDTIPLKLLTPEEVTQFDTGFGEPDGPRVDLTVVGIIRVARGWVGNGVGPVIGTPALAEAFPESLVGHNLLVRLADGPRGVAAFDRRLDRLREQGATGSAGEEFGVLQAQYPTSTPDPEVTAAAGTLVAGQAVFIGLAVLAGLLALGQGLARHHAVGAREQRIESALGLTRTERVLARLLPAAGGAVVAAAVTAGGVLLAGRVEPLGPLRAYEPEPGWLPDPALAALGGLAAAVVFLALTALTAAGALRVSGAAGTGARRSPVALSWLGRRAPAVAGLAFALRGGRGRGAVPVRATLAVAVVGLAGVVAVATFSSGLDRLGRSPARYGWAADFTIINSRPHDLADLAADPRVAALADTTAAPVQLAGRRVQGIAVRPLKGDVPLTLLTGRLPLADDEVALGTREARRLGVGVGATVRLVTYAGETPSRRSLRVVGLVVTPVAAGEGFGGGAFLTERTLIAASRSTLFTNAFVDVRSPAQAKALYADLAQRLEMAPAARPAEVRNLLALGRLPVLLALFLSLLALTVLAHALVLTTRRRAGELAVLRVIGLTPVQVAAALVAMAATIGVVGLALGPALGLAVGRVVWGEVASSIGVAPDPSWPWGVVMLTVPVVLVGAALVALLPARRAAMLSPAQVLRSE